MKNKIVLLTFLIILALILTAYVPRDDQTGERGPYPPPVATNTGIPYPPPVEPTPTRKPRKKTSTPIFTATETSIPTATTFPTHAPTGGDTEYWKTPTPSP